MKFSKYNVFYEHGDNFLLVNTRTGAMFTLDGELKQKIESGDVSCISEDVVKEYIKTGIVIDDSFNEYNFLKYSTDKEKFNNNILSLTILMTRNCNFKCTYCFEGLNKKSDSLKPKTKEAIFKFINNVFNENKNIKFLSITLFGGEPLLSFYNNFQWLLDIKKLCMEKEKEFSTMVITNGSLITEKILKSLKELNCHNIQITLDGIAAIHDSRRMFKNGKGSFYKVISGIKKIVGYNDFPNPVIRINIDKTNLKKTFELLEFLKYENLTDCYIDFGIVKIDSKEQFSNCCFVDDELGKVLMPLWEKLRELNFKYECTPHRIFNYCGLSKENFFTIDVDGSVYKCWELVGNKDYIVGYINEAGCMVDITSHYYDCIARDADRIEECRNCVYLPLCGCGCASVSIQKNDSIFTPGCFKTKSIFFEQAKLFLAKKSLHNTN